ncbi:MAG: WG repeat-containing protein [Ekhidna sp.]
MRSTILLFFLLVFLEAHSEEFTVFEKKGYYGIKDDKGQVTVPAVYEKLGWSTGQNEVIDGVIGYKSGNNWGLISIRNKALTEQKFFSLEPFKEGYVKGSIKGKFSNHLFYGLLNTSGKTVVSFNYFGLTKLEDVLLVSQYSNRKELFGIISMDNEVLIPLKYQKITIENNFQLASTFNQTVDLYFDYSISQKSLDSLIFDNGVVGHRAGYAGYINTTGVTDVSFEFKSVQFENGIAKGIPFPKWEVFQDQELQFMQHCDSLQKTSNQIWISYLNGAQHLTLPATEEFVSKDYLVREIVREFTIIQHSKTKQFFAIDVKGEFIALGYDSIIFSGNHFLCQKEGKWSIINSSGTQVHKIPLSKVLPSSENFFIAMKNEHWGVIDFNGDTYIRFKYDSIVLSNNHYEVKYLDKWGALDFHGNWIVQPEYTEIQSFKDIIIGRKGLGYSIFYKNQFKFKTISQPQGLFDEMVLLKSDSGKFGLLSPFGEMIVRPVYDEVNVNSRSKFISLRDGMFITLITKKGTIILDKTQRIEETGILSEGYLSIKKNDRWGFVDKTGKLRISNRYDGVHTFNEGLVSVQLRNKWGFIDKEEKLIIQPYYDQYSSFNKGLAIVVSDNQYGIIDLNGKVKVELAFKKIERLPTGNYKIEDQTGRYGIVNSKGQFLIRPAHEYLLDTGVGIVIKQNNKWGYLDYQGNQIFQLQYKDIRIIEKFLVLKS